MLDVGKINGERFAVMAGAGLDAHMIHDADGGLKDRFGRLAYIWTASKNLRAEPFKAQIDINDELWYKGNASCILLGNVGSLFGGIEAFDNAQPDDGLLEVGVTNAEGLGQWARTVARTAVGSTSKSPFVQVTKAKKIRIELDRKVAYELDGGDRDPAKVLKAKVEPGAITVRVPEREAAGSPDPAFSFGAMTDVVTRAPHRPCVTAARQVVQLERLRMALTGRVRRSRPDLRDHRSCSPCGSRSAREEERRISKVHCTPSPTSRSAMSCSPSSPSASADTRSGASPEQRSGTARREPTAHSTASPRLASGVVYLGFFIVAVRILIGSKGSSSTPTTASQEHSGGPPGRGSSAQPD